MIAVLLLSSCGDDDDTSTSADNPSAGDVSAPTAGEPDAPLGAGPYAIADLTVTYNHPDTGDIVYQFACFGDTATLVGEIDGVDAAQACTTLTNADVVDRLVNGPGDEACTEQYGGPETAAITGTLDGQAVDTTVDRANGCGIDDWDALLAPLLPAPRPFS